MYFAERSHFVQEGRAGIFLGKRVNDNHDSKRKRGCRYDRSARMPGEVPVFIRCGEKLIVCESYLAQGEVVLHFEGKASRNEFAKKNCDRYKSSCLHRRLMDGLGMWPAG